MKSVFEIATCSFPFKNNVNACVKCLKSGGVVFLPSRIPEVVLQPVIYLTRSNTSQQILGAGGEGFAPISLHRSTCP